MTMNDRIPPRISAELHASWGWLVLFGAILVVGGIALLLAPVLGGIVVTTWVAAIFLVGGVFQIVHAFRAKGWKSGLWHWISGLVYIVGGVLAFMNPLAGAVAITLILAITFLVDGAVRIALALAARPMDNWGWVLLSGIVSLLVGLYVAFYVGQGPQALILLGVFAGVSFLFEGIAAILLGFGARSLA